MNANLLRFATAALAASLVLSACASSPEAPAVGGAAPAAAKAASPGKNLALGKSISSNGHIYDFVPQSAVDGEVLSYYEGPATSFPNIVTLDLGEKEFVKALTLKLNPKRIWQARNQTIEVKVSDDGQSFVTAVPPVDYAFDPEENTNTVTITWEGKARYLQLVCTANTEATAFQIAEWEVLGN